MPYTRYNAAQTLIRVLNMPNDILREELIRIAVTLPNAFQDLFNATQDQQDTEQDQGATLGEILAHAVGAPEYYTWERAAAEGHFSSAVQKYMQRHRVDMYNVYREVDAYCEQNGYYTPGLLADTGWQEHARNGRKIDAIKAFRTEYGEALTTTPGLLEAKNAVEAWVQENCLCNA